MDDLEPLSEDLRAFLDAERELDVPALETRQRLGTRLAPLFIVPPGAIPGAPDPTSPAGPAATGASATLVKGGLASKLVVPAIFTTLGALGGAATHAFVAQQKPAPVVQTAAPVVAPSAATVPSASPPAAPVDQTPRDEEPSAATSGSARSALQSSTSLRAERLLLESATAALLRGDTASATVTLQRHARTYPHGALAEEREVLWVKVLRAQGNDKAAEQRASDFKQKFPSSLQQGAVDKPSGSK